MFIQENGHVIVHGEPIFNRIQAYLMVTQLVVNIKFDGRFTWMLFDIAVNKADKLIVYKFGLNIYDQLFCKRRFYRF